jgi:hypothetical protein
VLVLFSETCFHTKATPNIQDDVPMKTFWFTRLHFNYSQRHLCARQAISSKNNVILSILLTNDSNEVTPDASSIMFHVPNNYCRLTALTNTKKMQHTFRVYCKTKNFFPQLPPNLYLFCGTYFIASVYRKDHKLYFKFERIN